MTALVIFGTETDKKRETRFWPSTAALAPAQREAMTMRLAYLHKPLQNDELLHEVEQLIKPRRP
jgi:hypothetical protein